MLAIIIIIGLCALVYTKYSEVAFEFHKSRVGFGIAGIGIFIASYFVFQVIVGFIIGILNPLLLNEIAFLLIVGILSYGVGVLASLWILQAFKKSWRKQKDTNEQLLDS